MFEDDIRHPAEILIQDDIHVTGEQLLGEAGKPVDVRKKNGISFFLSGWRAKSLHEH
jgi:hypothetical protein